MSSQAVWSVPITGTAVVVSSCFAMCSALFCNVFDSVSQCVRLCFAMCSTLIHNCISWSLLASWTWLYCLRNFVTCLWFGNWSVSLSPWYQKGSYHFWCQKLQMEWPCHVLGVRMWQRDARPKFLVVGKGIIRLIDVIDVIWFQPSNGCRLMPSDSICPIDAVWCRSCSFM